MNDQIQSFIFEALNARGAIVQLDQACERVLSQHDYPPVLKKLLSESLVAVIMLFSLSKERGIMTLQFQGAGPVSLISVRCTFDRQLRALAKWEGQLDASLPLKELLGDGQLVLTYQSDTDMDQFQSIIPIEGHSIAETMEHYFAHSDQIKTHLNIVCENNQAAGLMLQQMPSDDQEKADADFDHVCVLAKTATPQELIGDDPLALLSKLYHQEKVRVFDARPVEFGCGCSVERMQGAIVSMGKAEATKTLDEHDSIDVTCEYCGNHYNFDREQVEGLFE